MEPGDLDWEDIRVFAAAAKSRSYRQAAAALGTTHPTVRRRLAALEAALGFTLFQRETPGLQPTPQGQTLLAAMPDVERAMARFAREARAADDRLRGPIRATMSYSVAVGLAPAIRDFAEAWPDITLTVETTTDFANLGALAADVAIRGLAPGSLPDLSLAGRKAAGVNVAVYGAADAEGWIASSPEPSWRAGTPFPELPVRVVMPEVSLRLEACRLGMGLAVLPCFVADPHLPRRSAPELGLELWVLVHPDMRRSPRLKRFRDAMVEAIRARSDALRG